MQVVNRKFYPAGSVIFKEGEDAHSAFMIQSGEVQLAKGTGPTAINIARLGPQALFGEMALIDGKPRSAGATAVTDTTVITISKGRFENVLEAADPFLRALLKVLVSRLRG